MHSNNPYKKYKEIAKLSVKDMSVVTTGDYQRYFIENGRVYNHVIDVNTLNPSKNLFSNNSVDVKIKVAIIGVGLRGQNHLDLLLRRDDVELVAISDINEECLQVKKK